MRYLSVFLLLLLQVPAFSASVPYEMLGYTNIVRAGATEGSDDTVAIQNAIRGTALLGGGTIIFPEGTFTATTLWLSNNITLEFQGGAKLNFKAGATGYAIEQGTATNVILKNVRLDGGVRTFSSSQGTRSGFHINASDGYTTVENCIADGFTDAGFRMFGTDSTGDSFTNATAKITGCRAEWCYEGYNFTSPNVSSVAEYSTLNNCQAASCYIGVNIGAGNTHINNCTITFCTRGIFVFGGSNGAHAIANGNNLNHNTFPIWCEGFANGYAFYNSSIQGGNDTIVISNCTGVVIEGGICDVAAITVGKSAGNATAGLNYLGPVGHYGALPIPTVVGGAQLLISPQNKQMDATNSAPLTTWIFTNMPSGTFPWTPAANGSLLTTSNGNLFVMASNQWSPVALSAPYDLTNSGTILVRYDVGALNLSVGNLIQTLTDSSGNGYHGITNSFNAPYYTNSSTALRGRGFIHFSGTSSGVWTNIAASFAQPLTIYAVCRPPVTSGTVLFASSSLQSFQSSGDMFLNAGSQISSTGTQSTNWYIFEFIANTTSSSIRINNGVAVTGNIGAGAMQGLFLGASTGGGQNANMDIAYFVVFTNAVSAVNSTNNFNWLNNRFYIY